MQKIEVMDEKSENNNLEQSIPVWIWILLAFAVVGVSSAGTMFQQIDEIPPLLRASWRLQATSLVLLPLAVLQWRWNCDASTRERCFEKSTILIMSISLPLSSNLSKDFTAQVMSYSLCQMVRLM